MAVFRGSELNRSLSVFAGVRSASRFTVHLVFFLQNQPDGHGKPNTVQYTVQYSKLHSTAVKYTTLHFIIVHFTLLYYSTLHYITVHYTTLNFRTVGFSILKYSTLHYITVQ